MRKTFVLGVGAQKAGTTWLHDYLARRPDADMGVLKEYRTFDASGSWLTPAAAARARRIERRAQAAIAKGPQGWVGHRAIVQLAFMSEPRLYFAYFPELVRPDGIALTGDMTTFTATLDVEALTRLRDGIEQRGLEVRAVYLMRDPVDRLRSMVKEQLRHQGAELKAEEELAALRVEWGSEADRMHSDYAGVVGRLEHVFGTNLHLELFERLFTQGAIQRLCAYLGVPFREAAYDRPMNESPSAHALHSAERAALAGGYEKQFRFCAERFGEAEVRRLWPSFAS